MILHHQINKQLRQREKDELQRFGLEDRGASDVGYDTPEGEEVLNLTPERLPVARSVSPAKKTRGGDGIAHAWSPGPEEGGETSFRRHATAQVPLRDLHVRPVVSRAGHGLSPQYGQEAREEPSFLRPRARATQKLLDEAGSQLGDMGSVSRRKPRDRRGTAKLNHGKSQYAEGADSPQSDSFNDRDDLNSAKQ
jgi:hypothetical protein